MTLIELIEIISNINKKCVIYTLEKYGGLYMETKPKKKFYKRWWFWVIVIVIVLGALGSGGSEDNKTAKDTPNKLTVEQKKEKTPEEIAAEKKTKEEEVKKLEEEKKSKEALEIKKWQEFVKKNTKKLPAGEHIVGTHLDAGTYEVTFNGSGNFIAYASDGSSLINEIGGSDLGISKYRAILPQGAKIQISGMSINVKPIKSTLINYGEVNLYAGYWIVGQDVTAGRYKATATNGSGNFFVYGSSGTVKTNEILGGEIGTPEVIINLEDGDIINIASLKNVKLVPEK